MSMMVKRQVIVCATMLLFAFGASPAVAQSVTTVENLTAEQVLVNLANPVSTRPIGETLALISATEIATTPFLLSSGGFVFKLDPATGLMQRTATTFGPSLIDRAITSGEGKVTVGATFQSVKYDQMSGFPLSNLPLASVTAAAPENSRTLTGNFSLTANTVAISGTVGVTENVDVGVVVPLLSVKLAGTSTLVNGSGVVARLAESNTIFSGIGDVAALAKYRFVKFQSADVPDPGGVALVVNVRLPTGDRANLRGLGVTRTLVGTVVSSTRGRLRPHGIAGFEHWSKNVSVGTDLGQSVSIRHRFQYGAGIEFEAAPKLTVLLEFLDQHILGGAQIEVTPENTNPKITVPGIASAQSMVAIPDGIHKAMLVPGLKVNLKGKMILSVNAIVTLTNNGLRPRLTPVAGIFLTM